MSDPMADIRPLTYEQWAETILDYFMPRIGPDDSATLSVDREALTAATGRSDAAGQLGRCVRGRLGPTGTFHPILTETRAWERAGSQGPVPSLPLLALTVVAAADMGENPEFHPNDFYRPLRRLLDPTDERRGAPSDFTEVIDRLWASLDKWLDQTLAGERGCSTFKPPPHPEHIGYSLAQAVVRGPDRKLLRRFLGAALDADEELDVAVLREPLAEWARRLGPRGRRLSRLAGSGRLEGICVSVLRQELDHFVGRERRAARRSDMSVLVELRPVQLQLVATRPAGFPAAVSWRRHDGTSMSISAASDGWYMPITLPRDELLDVLGSGLVIGQPPYLLEYEAAPILALRHDDQWGALRSVRQLSFGDSHHLLVTDEELGGVREFLEAENVDVRALREFSTFLPGWTLLGGVRFESRPQAEAPPDLASLIGTGSAPMATLVGGLRVPPLRRRYLTGGEPLLRMPWSNLPDEVVELEGDGEILSLTTAADGGRPAEIPLRGRGLAPGPYSVWVRGRRIMFELVDAVVDNLPRGVGEVTWTFDGLEVSGYVPVGGDWGKSAPVTFAARPDAEVLVLGARDDQFGFARDPAWLAELAGTLSWDVREISAQFPVAWIVVEERGARPEAFPVTELDPEVSGNGVVRWRTTLRNAVPSRNCTPRDRERLERYKSLARRLP